MAGARAGQVARGAARAAGLGLLAGGLEAAGRAASEAAPLGFGAYLAVGAIGAVLLGALAALASVPVGLAVGAARREDPVGAGALGLGLVGALIGGWYLWPAAAVLVGQGRLVGAVVFAALPLPLIGVVAYNARYWLRRAGRGEAAPPWLPIAAGAALLLTLGGAGVHAARNTGGGGALEGDPSVVILTVAGLTAPPDAPGARFTQVVSPSPDPRAAHAALWTGLHPLRTEVLGPAQVLVGGHRTVAEAFTEEGYATAAFVSAPALRAASGVPQGFLVVDDLVGGALSAVARTSVGRWLLPAAAPREASATVGAFERWYAGHAALPHLAWVQLDTPDADAIARVLAAVDAAGRAADTMVAVVGVGKEGPGLDDARVVAPLWLRAPGHAEAVVEAQVRLYDLAPTALEFARLDGLPVTEGIELLGYLGGTRSRPLPIVLVGRDGPDPFADALIGLRTNGVLYTRHVRTGVETLTDLSRPGVDIAKDQEEAVARARDMLAPDEAALRAILRGDP